MQDFYIGRGDRLPAITVNLVDSDGQTPNLSSSTVMFHMMDINTGTTITISTCSILDSPNAQVTYAWAAADTTSPLECYAQFEVTYPSGLVQSFPNDHKILIHITDDIA